MEKKLFHWTKDLSVHHEEIDLQHQELINILNDLNAAFLRNEHKDELSSIIDRLQEYTIYHFTSEESSYQKNNYSQLNDHKKIHDDFTEKISQIAEKQKRLGGAVTFELMNFLRKWLMNHIKVTDKAAFEAMK